MGRQAQQATPIKLAKREITNWRLLAVLGFAVLMMLILTLMMQTPDTWEQRAESNLQIKIASPVTAEQYRAVQQLLQDEKTGGFIAVDVAQMKQRIEFLPWVRRAAVRKQWPSDIVIELEKQQAVAVWNQREYINAFGELFAADVAADLNAAAQLPRITGPKGLTGELLTTFQQISALFAHHGLVLKALELTERRAWTLGLENGMIIRVGRENLEQRVKNFLEALKNVTVPQDSYIAYADLRYDTGFAISVKQFNEKSTVSESGAYD